MDKRLGQLGRGNGSTSLSDIAPGSTSWPGFGPYSSSLWPYQLMHILQAGQQAVTVQPAASPTPEHGRVSSHALYGCFPSVWAFLRLVPICPIAFSRPFSPNGADQPADRPRMSYWDAALLLRDHLALAVKEKNLERGVCGPVQRPPQRA